MSVPQPPAKVSIQQALLDSHGPGSWTGPGQAGLHRTGMPNRGTAGAPTHFPP